MLKKAGIIVAAVATGVLAVSSVAFADTSAGNLKNDCAFGNAGGAPAASAIGGSSRQIQPVEAFDSTSSLNNSEGFFQL